MTQGRKWRPWEAILAHSKALSHKAIKLLLLFIPKGLFKIQLGSVYYV